MDHTCTLVQLCLLHGEELGPAYESHLRGCAKCKESVQFSRLLHGDAQGPGWDVGERVLGRYELLERVGKGGQGVVFKARDVQLGVIVALKVVALDPGSANEVVHARKITHRNVCRLNYTDQVGWWRIIEMEYIEGGTLAHLLDRGSVPRAVAMGVFRGICAGVQAAHEEGVLHLDLKPANVLLRRGTEPVVSDFGLAVRWGSPALGGTPKYVAPEQFDGHPDVRADVYALGIILGELVPDARGRLRAVIERARAQAPADRPKDVASLVRELDDVPQGTLRRRAIGVTVAVVCALLVLAGVRRVGQAILTRPTTTSPTALPIAAASTAERPGIQSAAQITLPPPEDPDEQTERERCERWQQGAAQRRFVSPELSGSAQSLASKIGTRTLTAADLGRGRRDMPCSEPEELLAASWLAFVMAAGESPAAWRALGSPDEVSPDLRLALSSPELRLSADARAALTARAVDQTRRTLASARSAGDLEPARQWCALTSDLGVTMEPSCASVTRRDAELNAQRERCETAQEKIDGCRVDCMFKYDLFDARLAGCDGGCVARHRVPRCAVAPVKP